MEATWTERIEAWLQRTEEATAEWARYLDEAEAAVASANFVWLGEITEKHQCVTERVQTLIAQRQELLEFANTDGLNVPSLEQLSYQVSENYEEKRWNDLRRKLQQDQYRSLALWTMIRHCETHVSGVLRLLATGSTTAATYGQNEVGPIEGGQIVDEAA